MHFDMDYINDHIQYPEKLDFNLMRKAHHFSQLDTLTKQRYQISMNALIKQRYHLTRKLDTLAKQRTQLSLNALVRQRNHLREVASFSFHTQQVDACEKGLSFHTENSAPPTVCVLDLGCTRAMESRKAVDAFCRYVDSHPNSGLWYEIQPTSSTFFFANSQQSKCTEKIVIFMYDHGWNTQFTEFDIVEEGDVPLLMSIPQMRNLGFQFELTPDKAYLSCARIGMRKMVLKTS